ncbi:hypothetical protein [Malacoplasma muris]|uniref:hypothetical protein n=1 Tax=Malacoplasma muris TaxID=2119 RepID=UPI00398E6F82
MKYKKLIVSQDNKLVLEDYNLNTSNSEILDLNKSLYDVASDEELQQFIKENAIDPEKIYLICVKEDFGTNDQRIENIPDVKPIYKSIKKIFKKFDNVFFFVYNTFMKNEEAINPNMDSPSTLDAQEVSTQDEYVEPVDQAEEVVAEEYVPEGQEDIEQVAEEYIVEENVQEEPIQFNEEEWQNDQETNYDEFVVQTEANEQVEEEIQEPVYEEQVEEVVEDILPAEEVYAEQEEVQDQLIEEENKEEEVDWNAIPVIDTDDNFVQTHVEVEAQPDVQQADDKWTALESTNEVFEAETMTSDQLSSPYDEDVKRFNDISLSTANSDIENNDILIPESYYNEDNEEQISYEDYNEFQNDYELNVHALKSIYDFIWRMLVLNNYNLKLNDLLYLSVNNLDAFSVGQSDFVRQTANRAESLFDLILQLDIKLEFNNSLFYIYLAELFVIKSNKIVVNKNFLNTLSIWVNKTSKEKFVSQVEQFINYSSIYNKKIVFSYFIELSNFIKGCIPTISPSLNLVDIHRILTNPSKVARKDNVFAFMIYKMNEVFRNNGIVIESDLVETPDNMFVDSKEKYLDDAELNWKTKLSSLYKRLVENIRNYVLSKGNSETEIFNLYVDIKDLRMYKDNNLDSSLSTDVVDVFNHGNSYLTIGDAFERTPSIVPTQVEPVSYEDNTTYVSPVNYNLPTEKPYEEIANGNIENRYVDDSLVQPSRPTTRFNSAELEDSMTRRIEEYEKKIKENIARIEAERKNLREKMEALKNL